MSKHHLNRTVVIEAAVNMADTMGDYKLVTLMALAKQLNVRMPSLYNHINSLDDLHQAIALYGLKELDRHLRDAAVGLIGKEALLAMADAYRQFAHAHPGIYPLAVCSPETNEALQVAVAQDFVQMLMLVFGSFGLAGEKAQHAMRGYRALLHGFVALEACGGYRLPLSKSESFYNLLETYLVGLESASIER